MLPQEESNSVCLLKDTDSMNNHVHRALPRHIKEKEKEKEKHID